jgi:hypothetical protein
LPGFLKRYFSDFYKEQSHKYDKRAKPVLDFLSRAPSTETFYGWLEDSDGELDLYGDEERFVILAKWKVLVRICYLELTLEGKVMYEEIEQHLQFFESAMRKTYADNLLGECLMVTIG